MPVKNLTADGQLEQEVAQAAGKLVVADFFATWCGPCRTIAPQFEQLSNRYAASAVFVKINVEEMTETAARFGIRAMPTFIFLKNGQTVGQVQGADPQQIEATLKQHVGGMEGAAEGKDGMFDLTTAVDKSKSECLNEADDHTFQNLFQDTGYLESDCDEQLLLNLAFNQPIKLHSLKMRCTTENGPKLIRLFINLPRTLDFDQAAGMEAVQELTLTPKDLSGERAVPVKFVKFQNVQNMQIFVKNNQSDAETTRIDQLSIIGVPISATNMGDFKRVAGEKGEVDH
ncbi:hypothetical protein RvY_06178 [Ramazzottius varieornatus]|uniref:PITH domain-containing protein n=1 Tax=Ramazzottius varieornatus TaxID=947166 RepID=A0A1D1V7C1_RAMVA|nr:hypothetical protein RvY_06178 [Ramazzottius varieornatus]